MKGRPKTKPPTSTGRVLGEGLSVKWLDKYGRQQKGKKALREDETRKLHEPRERVEKISEIVDKHVANKVNSLVTEKTTAMMPRLFEAFGTWDALGRVGLPRYPV
jgi:predicted MarR family transcription regulator